MKTSCRLIGAHLPRARFSLAARFLALLLAPIAPLVSLQAQSNYATPFTFRTLAGSGGNSSSLDGSGTAASFLNPSAVAVDSSGSIYVADTDNNLIRKISSAGVVSTLAGSVGAAGSTDGTGSAASFNSPQGIAVDVSGNVYVADTSNNTIRKITPAGVVTTLAGAGVDTYGSADGTGSAARFNAPTGVAVDGSGNVYVADTYNSTIRKISPAGVVTTLAGTANTFGFADGAGSSASFSAPQGVAVDSSGNIFVADTNNATIRKITPAGVVTTLAGDIYYHGSNDGTGTAAQFSFPRAVSVDSGGNIYVADSMPYGSQTSTIRLVTPAGVVTTLTGGAAGNSDGLGTAAKFNNALGLAVDWSGNIYVADTSNQTVRKITSGGLVSTIAGGAGGPGSTDGAGNAARFNTPQGVAVDGFGYVYVADVNNSIIRKLSPSGATTTVTPSFGLAPPPLYGVAADGSGNVYFTDMYYISRLTATGRLSVFAGSYQSVGDYDSTIQYASFNFPQGVAADSGGNVYVADNRSNTIRKISGGVVTTLAGLSSFNDYTGDRPPGSADGTGSGARFNNPLGVAADNAGNVYVADTNNCTIRKITSAGVVTTLAGLAGSYGTADGTGSAARFSSPQGIAVDAAGNVYVADTGNHTIRGISPAGVVTTLGGLAGSADFSVGTGSAAHFANPTGIAVSSTGFLFVADTGYNSILVGSINTTPTISGQPANQSVLETQSAVFSVTTTGGYLTYQWRKNGVNIPGAISSSLTFSSASLADAGSYDVVATNSLGSVASTSAALSVAAIPVITSLSPSRQVLTPGQALNLSATANGTGPLTYQWFRNGIPLAGATANTYSVASVAAQHSGWYRVTVTDNVGTRRSAALFVIVAPSVTQVRAWGGPYQTQAGVPNNLTDAIALSGSGSHALALRGNGTVTAWGNNYSGQTNVPAGLAEVVAVSAGGSASLALKSDGTVVAWGDSSDGQTAVPAGLSSIVMISTGFRHCLALTSDGTVVAWGDGWYGQTDVPAGLSGVVAISAGMYSSLALKNDGTVVAWGENTYGERNVPVGLSGVIAISGSGYHALALKNDGTVVAWGDNSTGESTVPSGLNGVVGIATGSSSIALKNDGTVVGWGDNVSWLNPPPADLAKVVAVSTTMALRDGTGETVPNITIPPAGQVRMEGQTVSFSVTANGVGPISYQWRKNGVNIVGATSTSLALANLLAGDAGSYDVLVSNYLGAAPSAAAVLSVNTLPIITSLSPASQQLSPGHTLNLSVTATGTGSLAYQWIHNGVAMPGATGANYSLSNATAAASGWYLVTITDSIGTRRSAARFVSVVPALTQVVGWGISSNGENAVPPLLSNVVGLSAGYSHVLALKRDGSVVGWGSNHYGEATSPAGLTGVVQVAAGSSHSLALKNDGTVVAWGSNDSSAVINVPAGLSHVVEISAGSGHVLALKDDGTVVAWGSLSYPTGESNVPAGLTDVVQVAAGTMHSLALKSDGTVVEWGSNGPSFPVPAGLTGVVAISTGSCDLALKSDGTVVAWGIQTTGSGQNVVPAGLSGVTAIASGWYHSLALKNTGTVVGWGTNYYGEPVPPAGLSDVIAIVGGDYTSFAIRDASLDPLPSIVTPPANATVGELQAVSFTVAASGRGSLVYQWRKNGTNILGATASTLAIARPAMTDAGSYDVVVSNYMGSVTSTAAVLTVNPIPMVTSLSSTRQVLLPGGSLSLSVTATGTGALSYQWVHNGISINGATGTGYAMENVAAQHAGWYAALITDSNGTRRSAPIFIIVAPAVTQVRSWGYTGAQILTNVPPGLTNVISLDAGFYHVLALKRDGSVIGWGHNETVDIPPPAGLSDAVAVAAGRGHSMALKSDGTVVAWGSNASGQANVPAGLTDVVGISAGDYFSLALKSDGTVVGWGNDGYGASTVPIDLTGVVAIAAGRSSPIALKSDGTVASWGTFNRGAPPGVTGLIAISACTHSLAVKNDGTVAAWGGNGYGQSSVPIGLSGVIAVAAGYDQSLALKSDGSVVGWGDNTYGAVIPPSDLANVLAISANNNYSMALRDGANDTTPGITTPPSSVTVVENQAASFTVSVSGVGPFGYQWRKNGNDIAGATNASLTLSSVAISAAGNYDVVVTNYLGSTISAVATLAINPIPVVTNLSPTRQMLAPGQGLNLTVAATGTGPLSYQWIHNGAPINEATSPIYSLPSVTATDGGWYVVLITDSFGTRRSQPVFVMVGPSVTQVRGWGYNAFGQATGAAGVADAVAISCGSNFGLALRRNGQVFSWGYSSYGVTSVPDGLTDAVAISAGGEHALVVKSDGTVVAWGNNQYGQAAVPVGLNNVVAVAGGETFSAALKSDGTVVCWGNNSYGQTTPSVGLTNVVSVSAGYNYCLALKRDGTVVAWGDNSNGQSSIPDGLNNVVSISAGTNQALALRKDGTVVTWGYSSYGQTSMPPGLGNVMAVTAGSGHFLALLNDGSFQSWGTNSAGEGTVPSGLTNIIEIAAGSVFSLALSDATPVGVPVILTQPFGQSATVGRSVTLTAAADGRPTPTYQWQKGGIDITGATGSSYTIASAALGDSGNYTVVASNSSGSVASASAALEVGTPPAGFDVAGYLSRYPDVAAVYGTNTYGAWLYYRNQGIYDGEVFDDLFRVEEYLTLYPDLFAIFGSNFGAALDHWLSTGRIEGKLGRIPLEFSAAGYFTRNPDVAAAVNNDALLAWGHYWLYGIYEGRAYDNELRVFEYLAINADLTAAFVDDWRQAALHWMRYGRTEGRLGRLPLTFAVPEYLNRSPDVAAVWGTNPTTVFLHYWIYGIDENRTYDDLFRPDEYLALNPDLTAALGTDRRRAFKHWVRYGMTEGRPGRNP